MIDWKLWLKSYIGIFWSSDDFFVFFPEGRIDRMIAQFGAALRVGVTQALEGASNNWSWSDNVIEHKFGALQKIIWNFDFLYFYQHLSTATS